MNERRIAVVKVGGKEIAPGPSIERFARWAAAQVRRGHRLVVVHGGGDEVSERAAALGLPTEKRFGQRVTSAPMLEVVLEVLAGRVNARLVGCLTAAGLPSVGLSGVSGRLLTAVLAGDPPGSLGFVGKPAQVRPLLLETLLEGGYTPVVAPVGVDSAGQPLNVNADLAAGALARALRADLWLVTDVPGVRDAGGSVLARLSVSEAHRLLRRGTARDGMVPKLQASEAALGGGRSVWIGDLDALERFPRSGGTTIVGSRRVLVRGAVPLAQRERRA
ncbi:MAG: acetylglutamate kinase [Thermoplasmata archaeon]|nr:acetylglutamate kinase [Thermoplasmata archaeon]MCI4359152.1 acetylglutamate kinase [Thermoplasmata archaeon]